MTGLCNNLCSTFNKYYISTKFDLVSVEKARPEPSVAQSPPPMPEFDMEIGRPPNFEGPGENYLTPSTANEYDMEIGGPSNIPELENSGELPFLEDDVSTPGLWINI